MHFKITSLPCFLPLSILFVQNYVPTVFENYTASFEIDTQRIELSLWDTSGKSHRTAWRSGRVSRLSRARGGSRPGAWHALSARRRAAGALRPSANFAFSEGFPRPLLGENFVLPGWVGGHDVVVEEGGSGEKRALCTRRVTPRRGPL